MKMDINNGIMKRERGIEKTNINIPVGTHEQEVFH